MPEPVEQGWWTPTRIVIALALAVGAIGLLNDFVYDDVPIIRDNVRLHSLTNWREIIMSPWWPPPFVEQLHRPFASLLLAVQYAAGGGSPVPFRIVSLLLHVGATLAVLRLARLVLSSRAALLAGALFAAHPVHVEAIAQGVNQGDLIAGLVAAVMAAEYIVCRRRGELHGRDWARLAALYLAALGSKESGYVLIVIPALVELTLITGVPRLGMNSIIRGCAALGGAAAVGFAWRAAAVGAAVGVSVPAEPLRGLDLGSRMLAMLQVVPEWARLLVWPSRLQVDFEAGAFAAPGSLGAAAVVGLVLVVGTIVLIGVARRRAPAVAFGLALCAIGLLPVSNVVPAGIMLAERTLYLPSVGFLIAVGAAGSWLVAHAARSERSAPRIRDALAWACVLMIVMGVGKSVNRLSLWNSAHLVVRGTSPSAE